jgi:putative DNA primase/helicase
MFSNELIKLRDDSGALPGRFITFRMTQSFWGREDLTLGDTLKAERPGILNLALDALDQLRDRDYFLQPQSGLEMARELAELASYITLFVRECCVIGPEHEVYVHTLYSRWQSWCGAKGIRWGIAEPQFSQKIRAAVHTVTDGRPRSGGKGRPTLLIGLGLLKSAGVLDRR